jgi:hypothetical protein
VFVAAANRLDGVDGIDGGICPHGEGNGGGSGGHPHGADVVGATADELVGHLDVAVRRLDHAPQRLEGVVPPGVRVPDHRQNR